MDRHCSSRRPGIRYEMRKPSVDCQDSSSRFSRRVIVRKKHAQFRPRFAPEPIAQRRASRRFDELIRPQADDVQNDRHRQMVVENHVPAGDIAFTGRSELIEALHQRVQ